MGYELRKCQEPKNHPYHYPDQLN